ncbi:MAG: lysoplasmalogenase [Rhodothermales bacterium]|nr:lysoplasmalogenase [Rhodothermales bacterium]
MVTALLSAFALTSAVVLVRAERQGFQNLVYLAKPLAMISIILIAVFAWPTVSDAYRLWMLIGLGFSLLGDIALMLPRDRFLAGLSAFLVGHVAYAMAFLGRLTEFSPLPYLPFALAAVFIVVILWRHLDRLRLPVIVYAAAIAVMAGSAWAVAMATGSLSGWLAAAGASLFLFSDVVLALNRFVGEIKNSDALIVATYFPGQLLLALSVFG